MSALHPAQGSDTRYGIWLGPGSTLENSGELQRTSLRFWTLTENFFFLKKEIPETPYHIGPVEDETLPLIDGLLRLHDFRLLTDGSQPYEHQCVRNVDQEYVEYQQRPYVSFLMAGENDQALKFFEMLKSQSEIAVRAFELYSYKLLPGSHEQIVISRERIAKPGERLESMTWKDVTWAFYDFNLSEKALFSLDAVKESKVLWFEVAASEWGVSLSYSLASVRYALSTITDTHSIV